MIPIYICDDEKPVADRLEHIISNQITILNGDMGPVREADTPERLLDLQTKDTIPAVYFLDIDFPGRMSGLELAQKLRLHDPRGFIVFITAHHDLAFETFRLRLEALDYIVKGDYNAMAVRVRECLTSIQQRLASEQPKHGRYCTIILIFRTSFYQSFFVFLTTVHLMKLAAILLDVSMNISLINLLKILHLMMVSSLHRNLW